MLYLPMPAGKRLRYSFRIYVYLTCIRNKYQKSTHISTKNIDKFWKQIIINVVQ